MPPDFHGKVVLVTGVGRVGQIGHAVARGFGRAGAKLLLADVNAVGLADRVKEFGAEGISAKASAGDLTQPDVARAATAVAQAQFGGLDVVVNVAGGFFSYGPFTEVKPEILDRELAVNFKTAFYMCQAALPLLLTRGGGGGGGGGGAIVNFASIAVVRPLMHMSAYSAAKSAVAGLTRELAREYRDAGIRVNAVAPATVRTADNVAQMGDTQPLVELEEVVNTVLFLASSEASAITGQIVPIAGKAS